MDRPPVFADESFATALEKTRSSPGLLIVDASAEWCGPCKHMDRTTWRDMEVVSWCEANATVLQIDMDQEKEWAQTHRISAMPTLIAFKNGAEFDRIVGGRQPRALLDWLEGLLKGETSIETLRRSVSESEADTAKRFELARALHASGDLDEATREYAWLWEHITEANPEMAGVVCHSWRVRWRIWPPEANRPARAFGRFEIETSLGRMPPDRRGSTGSSSMKCCYRQIACLNDLPEFASRF
jgi:thioredoxin-like negative regulator of GroEL